MEGSAQSLWERCLPIIRNNVDEKQYRTWFEPIQIISFEKQVPVSYTHLTLPTNSLV